MPNTNNKQYSFIADTSNVVGNFVFRLIGSWNIPASFKDDNIKYEIYNMATYKIKSIIVSYDGEIIHPESDSTSNNSFTLKHSDCDVKDLLSDSVSISEYDDRFDIASKIITVEVLREMKQPTTDKFILSPRYKLEKANSISKVVIDCIVLASVDSSISGLLNNFKECLNVYLRRYRKHSGSIYHFLYQLRIITVNIPSGSGVSCVDLHHKLNIPLNQSVFAKSLNIFFKMPSGLLMSVHRNVKPLENVIQGMVQGPYQYYHYLTDKDIDDRGWGCAYRSLQTICSWFLLNGYTDLPVPSIYKIQETLVLIGDKPATFINTPKWIGTLEASYVLDSHLGKHSRIVHMNNIKEIRQHVFMLLTHFRNAKCPVMLGGGSLAHTLLGVSFIENDEESCRFLILDPHYHGKDNITNIIEKGYCGWKDISFWRESAYYNMCLPIPSKS
ncbi:hypothetical protein GJ496_002366 [Pomphorhynchus laevis]|nr:hypothetical protein GJ496_002366 [Pomphorhynchus laevis]